MSIRILNKRISLERIKDSFPNGLIIDVTSKSNTEFIQLSPFFPHKNIPVPFSPNHYSHSVEGIWQGLKVFENCDIDMGKFQIENMTGIKRSTKKYGYVKGHRKGVDGDIILNYIDARKLIYIPTYNWVLKNKNQELIEKLRQLNNHNELIILLDYEVNDSVDDISKPLSHAALIRDHIIDCSPPK